MEVYSPSPGNNFAVILNCPNACVCDANGLCAQILPPFQQDGNFALFPHCTCEL